MDSSSTAKSAKDPPMSTPIRRLIGARSLKSGGPVAPSLMSMRPCYGLAPHMTNWIIIMVHAKLI
ncbi:Uncharacterised protein [Bordetella pertussis]|nr:Uncharacterised protein [Bordetella pertussis]